MKQGCSNYTKPSKTPQREAVQIKEDPESEEGNDDDDAEDDDEEGGEEEVVVEEVSKSHKGKGLLKSLASPFKRKQEDRSPEASPPSKSKSRFALVGVIMPPPPLPYSSYTQLGSRTSTASLAPSFSLPPPSLPPVSASPSLVSFDSQGSGNSGNFEADRYRMLYRMSQEDLQLQQQQFAEERAMTLRRQEERERRQQEQFAVERALYESRIAELEQAQQGEASRGSGSSVRGGSRRR